jgi:hypothetical protein
LTVPSPPEGDDHVVGVGGGLGDELDRVPLALGVDGGHVVATLERVHDQVLEPVGHRGGVRVDDDQHALGLRRTLERGDAGEALEVDMGRDGHSGYRH